jgi:hypothetical protein
MTTGLVARFGAPSRRKGAGRVPGAGSGLLRPSRDVLSAEQDGTVVLLDLRRGVYFGLDDVGTFIWHHIETGASEEQVVAALGHEYDASADALRCDVDEFVVALQDRGLVVRT